jgi:endonuclease/exonuclease/phosphatase family metal-dependent hydrolase
MRVLSYNIHGCVGRDGREDPDRVLEVIRRADADIVGLQEVHQDDALDRDFLRKLEHLPYRAVLYGKTMRKPSANYGNVLLLREPPTDVQRIELPTSGGEPRGMLLADTQIGGVALRVAVTHLDIRARDRREQAAALIPHLLPETGNQNLVLLGDLNEWLPIRPYFRRFAAHFDARSRCRTFPLRPALFPLDRIALRGNFLQHEFKTDRRAPADNASDHWPLLCHVEWSPNHA